MTSPIDIAGRGAGRPQRQAHGVAGKVAREQQIALGFVAVEHRLLGQLAEIAGEDAFGAGRVAAHPHLRQMRHQHLEADDSVGDSLLGHLDRGDVAGVAQDGRGAVADFADDGDRHVVADEGRVGASESRARESLQPLELGAAKDEMDRAEFGTVERAGRALDPAFDFEPRRVRAGGGVTGRVTSSRVGGTTSAARSARPRSRRAARAADDSRHAKRTAGAAPNSGTLQWTIRVSPGRPLPR